MNLLDAEVIALCAAAGIKWLEPDKLADGTIDSDGFPGSFDMATMVEMRALITTLRAVSGRREVDDGGPYNGIDWRETLRAAAKRLRLGVQGPRIADELDALSATTPAAPALPDGFQAGVEQWMSQCFLPSLYSNMIERGDRCLEEVIEMLQAHDYPRERIPTLVEYVYSRPVGEPKQEVGGVMVTLAGFCWIARHDMMAEGWRELRRITQPEVMAKIRAKQEAKNALHFDTPLPGAAAPQREEG